MTVTTPMNADNNSDNKPSLLIVDDDNDVLISLQIWLEGEGFRVLTALNSQDALKIVEEEKLLDSAIDLAREMLLKSPLGLRMTKQALNLSLNSPSLETMIQLENRGQVLSGSSKDVFEAFNAYMEKREPKFPLS